eukprot:SAG11_NODE_86_length_17300_cov_11.466717_14_plen_221_part_00
MEGYASPLNAWMAEGEHSYFALFAADRSFGSLGPARGPLADAVAAADGALGGKMLLLNPPYHPPAMLDAVTWAIDAMCGAAEPWLRPAAALLVLPHVGRGGALCAAHAVLEESAQRLRAAGARTSSVLLPARQHVFMQGHAHRFSKRFHTAQHDTSLWLLHGAALSEGDGAAALDAVAREMAANAPGVQADTRDATRRHVTRYYRKMRSATQEVFVGAGD